MPYAPTYLRTWANGANSPTAAGYIRAPYRSVKNSVLTRVDLPRPLSPGQEGEGEGEGERERG